MANRTKILQQIGLLIKELSNEYNTLSQQDNLTKTEAILFEAKCRFLQDHAHALNESLGNKPVDKPQIQEEKVTPVTTAPSPAPAPKTVSSPSLNDTIRSPKNIVNDMLVQKGSGTDLRKSIGLNDKFAFIKALFNGDSDAFDSALTALNNCNNATEALQILKNLQRLYNWNDKSENFIRFLEFVKKRFV